MLCIILQIFLNIFFIWKTYEKHFLLYHCNKLALYSTYISFCNWTQKTYLYALDTKFFFLRAIRVNYGAMTTQLRGYVVVWQIRLNPSGINSESKFFFFWRLRSNLHRTYRLVLQHPQIRLVRCVYWIDKVFLKGHIVLHLSDYQRN